MPKCDACLGKCRCCRCKRAGHDRLPNPSCPVQSHREGWSAEVIASVTGQQMADIITAHRATYRGNF